MGCEGCEQGKGIIKGKYEQINKPTIQPEKKEVVMTAKGRKSRCKNCGRIMAIQSHGMCGLCNNAVKGLVEGTPEYIAALKDAKERALKGEKKERGHKSLPVKYQDKQKALSPIRPGSILKAHKGIVLPGPQIIPVVLDLSIEISVKVKGISEAT